MIHPTWIVSKHQVLSSSKAGCPEEIEVDLNLPRGRSVEGLTGTVRVCRWQKVRGRDYDVWYRPLVCVREDSP